MSNEIIRSEFAGELLGVAGRFFNVIGNDETRLIRNQKFISTSRIPKGKGYGPKFRMSVEIRFDDECNNGHETFAITATITGPRGFEAGGCLHDEITATFPEFAPLIKWHLTSTDGPMHYLANTLYLASDRDYNGRRKGEASSFDHVVYVGDSPVSHKLPGKFIKWLETNLADADHEWIIDKIDHPREPKTYGSKYSFIGFCEKWHECPFDSEAEANEWLQAVTERKLTFAKIPTAYSEGKERELDSARRAAVWPEATDDQLCADRQVLEGLLNDRLPGLIAEFKATMAQCGFILMD